jgi:D-alanyl-D-alanine carboxypeptidase
LRTPLLASAFAPRNAETGALDQERVARLDAAFARALTATGAPSATAAVVIPGSGVWRATYPTPPAGVAPLHYWASAGKSFTAVAILQLVEEGKLSLVDPISRWIKGVPNGDAITIEHLLNHTSGLFSANEDRVVKREGRRLGLEDELRIARRHGAMFCPGENWRYSNTGYTLLGAILERVEQRPYAQIITDRIIQRLGPVRVRVVTPDDPLTDVAAPAANQGVRAIDPRVPGAAGAMAGDADGMIAFWRALLGGELLSQDLTRAMFARLYPMFGEPSESYGLGVMAYELPAQAGGPPFELWVGHSGGAPGVKAVAAYSLTDHAFVAVAVTGDGSAEAFANLLLHQIGAPAR